MGVRQVFFDQRTGLNEIDRIVIVLGNAGMMAKMFGSKMMSSAGNQCSAKVVSTFADLGFYGQSVGPEPLFIKVHHNDGCAVTTGKFGLFDELGLAFLLS